MGDEDKITITVKGVDREAWAKAAASAKRHGEFRGNWFSRVCHQIAAQEESETPTSAEGEKPVPSQIDEQPGRIEAQLNSVERQQARMAADLADLRLEVLELRRRLERAEKGLSLVVGVIGNGTGTGTGTGTGLEASRMTLSTSPYLLHHRSVSKR